MMAKLNTNAKTDGPRCMRPNHNSRVVLMPSDAGILMSMIRSVSAMAKTPSKKISSRVFGCESAMSSGRVGLAIADPSRYSRPSAVARGASLRTELGQDRYIRVEVDSSDEAPAVQGKSAARSARELLSEAARRRRSLDSCRARMMQAAAPPGHPVLVIAFRHADLDTRRGGLRPRGLRHQLHRAPALVQVEADLESDRRRPTGSERAARPDRASSEAVHRARLQWNDDLP